jgi:hypothetical protein
MEHYNVLIATPGRIADMAYVKSLVATLDILNQKKITYKFLNEYSPNIYEVRELTIMDGVFDSQSTEPLSGKVSYDKIFFIDSDMSWTPQNFLDLYYANKDIVSGIYLNINKELQHYPQQKNKLNQKFIEVDDTGFGFIAIKSGVFESMPRPWFFYRVEDNTTHKIILSEDISWCMSAKECGFKIFIYPEASVVHHKTVPIYITDL